MSKTLQLKRGNTSISNSYTGSPGEVTVDTTNWDLRVHDGVTAGGWVVDSSNSGGSFGNVTVSGDLTANNIIANNDIDASGNITANYFIGNGSQLTGLPQGYTDSNVATFLNDLGSNVITTTGDITANAFIGDGSQLTGLPESYTDSNVITLLGNLNGNIIPSANATYNLGDVSNQWKELWVSNNTIYIGGVAIGISENVLTVGGEPLLSNSSSSSITTSGNITAGNLTITGTIDGYATTSFVSSEIANLVSSAPGTLDTLNELAAALGDDPNFATTISDSLGNIRTNVTTLQGNITSIESDISSLQATTHANLESNVATLESDVTTLQGNISSLANVATSGSYNDLSNKPTIPSLGNYTITDNTIQTSNGVGGITLGIFGADGADPPSFVTREWLFANTGILTTPSGLSVTSGNVSATGAVLSGNATVGNLHVSRNIYAQAISTSAGITGYAITSNNTINATGNATVGGILTDNYYFANGDPFISSNYNDSSVVNLLSDFGSNSISTTGNITASNFEGNITTTGNITAANFEGNITITGNVTGTSANVELVAGEYTWAFDNTGNLTLPGNIFAVNYANGAVVSLGGSYGNSDVASYLVSYTGNVTAGNILTDNYFYANGDPFTSSNYGNSDVTSLLVDFGSNIISTTGNITAGNLSSENVTATNLIGSELSLSGNITGSSANVTITANSFVTTFDTTGLVTFPGNVTVNGNLFATGTDGNVVTKFESSWTVPTGNSTQSFTVDVNNTYYLWVEGNIPNGIIVWNATATVTNTNVPVVGAQYAWVYDGGGTPIDFTSLPNQFVGTANTIVRSSLAPSATSNQFDFGINNTSGSEQAVRYGWVRIS